MEAWKRWLPEVVLAVLLAGKQLASDRKGSAIRGLRRAPKPTKKCRTWGGRRSGMGRGMVQASYLIPHFVSHLGNKGMGGRRGEE